MIELPIYCDERNTIRDPKYPRYWTNFWHRHMLEELHDYSIAFELLESYGATIVGNNLVFDRDEDATYFLLRYS